MRLPPTQLLILELLLDAGNREQYGLEMVKNSSGRLKRGTVYVLLKRLEEKGLVQSRLESRADPAVGIARRLYKVTGAGQRVVRAHEVAAAIMADPEYGR